MIMVGAAGTVAHAPGGTSVRDVRIELVRGALIGGTMCDACGQRITVAHVVVTAASGVDPTCEGDTGGQGEFRLHDCPTGDLDVAASKAALWHAIRTTVRPGDEVLSLAIELRQLAPAPCEVILFASWASSG